MRGSMFIVLEVGTTSEMSASVSMLVEHIVVTISDDTMEEICPKGPSKFWSCNCP